MDHRLFTSLNQHKKNSIIKNKAYKVLAANHSKLNILGQASKPILLKVKAINADDPDLELVLRPFIAKNLSNPMILNLKTLKAIGTILDLPRNRITIESNQKQYHYPLQTKKPSQHDNSVFLTKRQKVTIPANTEVDLQATCQSNLNHDAYFEPNKSFQQVHHLHVISTICQGQKRIPLKIINNQNHPISIKPHVTIGKLVKYSDTPDVKCLAINAFGPTANKLKNVMNEEPHNSEEEKAEKEYDKEEKKLITRLYVDLGFHLKNCQWNEDEKWEMVQIFMQNRDALALTEEDVGNADIYVNIDTGDHPPFQSKCKSLNPDLLEDLRKQLDVWIKQKVVEKANQGSWSSPLVAVLKKNKKIRWCLDLRRLNKITRYDARPIRTMQQNFSKLFNDPPYKFFFVADISQAYFSINVDEESKEKLAFACPFGLFRFLKLCYGLQLAPSAWHQLVEKMQEELEQLDHHFASQILIYFDDCLCPATDYSQLLKRINLFLFMIRTLKLKVEVKKCKIKKDKVEYCGSIVSGFGIQPSQSKTACLEHWPACKTIDQVRGLHGLMNQYRKYIRNFASRTFHIRQQLKTAGKGGRITWDDHCEKEKEDILNCLKSEPILGHPQYGPGAQCFRLYCDSSNTGLGHCLKQEQMTYNEDTKKKQLEERTIAFGSRRLSPGEEGYSTYKLELLAIINGLEHFKFYILQQKVQIFTDNRSLSWLLSSHKKPIPNICFRWLQRIEYFRPFITITHIPGRTNVISDSLSRRTYNKNDYGNMKKPDNFHAPIWGENIEFDHATASKSIDPEFWIKVMSTNMKKRKKKILHTNMITRRKAKLEQEKVAQQKLKRQKRKEERKAAIEKLPKRVTRSKQVVLQPRTMLEEAEEQEAEQEAEEQHFKVTETKSVDDEAKVNEAENRKQGETATDAKTVTDAETVKADANDSINLGQSQANVKDSEEEEKEGNNDHIPYFDLENEIPVPTIISPKTNNCLEYIIRCQNKDPSINWLKQNLNENMNIQLEEAVREIFGPSPREKQKEVGFFMNLFKVKKKMKVVDNILKIQHADKIKKAELIVLNEDLSYEMIHLIHSNPGSSHLGINKTTTIFQQYFFCPRSIDFITKYINSCKPCIDGKRITNKPAPLGQTSSYPHQRLKYWSCDLVQLPCGKNGEKYIFSLVDFGSLWLEAYALKSKHSQNVVDALENQFYPKFGYNKIFSVDAATEFTANIVRNSMIRCGEGEQYIGTSYWPQSHYCERSHRTLLNNIRALLLEKELPKESWVEMLPLALFNYRCMPNFNGSAFQRVYGTWPRTKLTSILGMDPNDNNQLKKSNDEAQEEEEEFEDRLYPDDQLKQEDVIVKDSPSYVTVSAPKSKSRRLFKVQGPNDLEYYAEHINTIMEEQLEGAQKMLQRRKNEMSLQQHERNKKRFGKNHIIYIPNEIIDLKLFVDPLSKSSRKLRRTWIGGYCIKKMINPLKYVITKLHPVSWAKTEKDKIVHPSHIRASLQIGFQERKARMLPWEKNMQEAEAEVEAEEGKKATMDKEETQKNVTANNKNI